MGFVLIADDTAANCRMLAELLSPEEYDVRTTDDGAEALRLIRADPPDLVLMGVLMSGVDGFQAPRERSSKIRAPGSFPWSLSPPSLL